MSLRVETSVIDASEHRFGMPEWRERERERERETERERERKRKKIVAR